MDIYSDGRARYPDDLFYTSGMGFLWGAIYGPTHHFIRGIYNSPKGQRLVGASQAMRLYAPRVTSRFAARFAVLGIFESIIFHARDHREKPCDTIVAGAATGGFLKLRHGVRAASRSALIGGTTMSLLQGLWIWSERREASKVKYVGGKGFPVKEPEATPVSK